MWKFLDNPQSYDGFGIMLVKNLDWQTLRMPIITIFWNGCLEVGTKKVQYASLLGTLGEEKGKFKITAPEMVDAPFNIMTVHEIQGFEFPIVIFPFGQY